MGLFCPQMLAFAADDDAGARRLIAAAVAETKRNPRACNSPMSLAQSYRKLGDLTNAMHWYERAYQAIS